MVLRFQISPETDEDGNDEPAEKKAEDEAAEVFQLRGCPAPDRFFRHGFSFIKPAAEHKRRAPMITQAFVLGAGLGTRLRPLTEDLPKPLIPIFQKPLITFVLDHLIDAGIKSFVVNTHHRPEAFRDFFSKG